MIVISAINLFEGGPLSILLDVIKELSSTKYEQFEIIFFIHKKILFKIPNPQGEIRYVLSPSYEHDLTISNKQKTYFMCTCCEEIQMLNDPFFQQFKFF